MFPMEMVQNLQEQVTRLSLEVARRTFSRGSPTGSMKSLAPPALWPAAPQPASKPAEKICHETSIPLPPPVRDPTTMAAIREARKLPIPELAEILKALKAKNAIDNGMRRMARQETMRGFSRGCRQGEGALVSVQFEATSLGPTCRSAAAPNCEIS